LGSSTVMTPPTVILTLLQRKLVQEAEAVKAVKSVNPDIAFAILKQSMDVIAGKTVGPRKHIRPSLVHMRKPVVLGPYPQAALALRST
jgi:hypothetical protein